MALRSIPAPGWARCGCVSPAERFDSSDVAVEAYVRLGETMPYTRSRAASRHQRTSKCWRTGERSGSGRGAYLVIQSLLLVCLRHRVKYPVGDSAAAADAELERALEDGRAEHRAAVFRLDLLYALRARERCRSWTRREHRKRVTREDVPAQGKKERGLGGERAWCPALFREEG